jgi:cytochrome c-type biogenesis protein CcmF
MNSGLVTWRCWLALALSLVHGRGADQSVPRRAARLDGAGAPLALAAVADRGGGFVLLAGAFVNNDFSVLYVAQNSNSAPAADAYRIAGVWGGHEGSLLLWAADAGQPGWMLAVALFSRHLPAPVVARILGVMGLVTVGFLLFTLPPPIPSTACSRCRPMAAT